jgi:hypothetical protein
MHKFGLRAMWGSFKRGEKTGYVLKLQQEI